jgi:hypothetical protein
MKNGFEEEQNLLQPSVRLQNRNSELSPRQAEIYRNLEAIGPEIAAFYLSGVKVLQDDDLETSSYLLAHIAREIEGGLRDVLSEKRKEELKFVIETPDGSKSTCEKGKEGSFKFVSSAPGIVKVTYNRIGKHKASILQSLGVDENSPIAERWISVAKRFAEFAHRHGTWEPPREKEAFVPLWNEFENVLVGLVGNHFNFLNTIDRILCKEPTEERIKRLPKLLKSRVRYAYFFNNLDSSAWLKPLQDAGWFYPDSQPTSQEMSDQPVHFWHALGYVEKVANHAKETPCEETFNTLADIVNTIVNYTHDAKASIASDHTNSQVIKIICALPVERIESRHIAFIGVALKSRVGATLMGPAIGETVLPKLLNGNAKELTLVLLENMLDAEVIHGDIRAVMEEYWLWNALQKHEQAITELCGVEAVQITCARIRALINEGAYSFNVIRKIDSAPSDYPDRRYAELLVGFTSSILRAIKFDNSIEEIVKDLLQEGLAVTYNDPVKKEARVIFGRIAFDAIIHHYEDLKKLFWEWEGNPLEEFWLKPSIYQLIHTRCFTFDEREFDQILHWIESCQYSKNREDDEELLKSEAFKKREWLSALMETGNEKVVSAYEKYQRINPAELERPGLLWWTEVGSGNTSPTTIEELSDMSSLQISNYLTEFKERGIGGSSDPTERGLAETLEEYVTVDPQKFADDLQPFYGIQLQYQYSLLQGFLKAWRDKNKFNWAELLKFIHHILTSKQFRTEVHKTGLNYRDWILSATAELIKSGTADDKHAFDVQLLPLAEKILLVLAEKVKSDNSASADVPITVLNSTPEKVFSAMIDYALRFARTNEAENWIRWTQAIKMDFTKRLDRSLESAFEFSFTLGAYLPNLLYLDKEWVVGNINRIFPQQNEYHWQAAFSGYLYNYQIYADLYSLLKEHGHYRKALNTDFADREVPRGLVEHICVGWIEDSETLDDKTSLIYQLINSDNSNLLSTLVHFFWRQRSNLSPKVKAKVRPTWRALYESLSQKGDVEKYGEVLSRLSGWIALVDKIDEEVLKWLKLSTQHIRGLTDSAFFVEGLLSHTSKTPAEVGEIYLEMLYQGVYPYHDQEHIQEIVRTLYNTKHKEVADRICNLYGEAGFDFLRSLYDENQN